MAMYIFMGSAKTNEPMEVLLLHFALLQVTTPEKG